MSSTDGVGSAPDDPENVGRSQDDARRFVVALYQGVLRRKAGEEEIEYWAYRCLTDLTPADIVEEFLHSEEFLRQSASPGFVPPGHFYSPVVDPAEADAYIRVLEQKGMPAMLPGIPIDRGEMVETWRQLLPFMQSIPFREQPYADFRYGFVNPMYSWGDGSVLHSILRQYRPKKIIEIGSGWSSACIRDTAKHFLEDTCEITFIEPHPERLFEVLGVSSENEGSFQTLTCRLQEVSLEVFDRLQQHDILFIDSSHVLRTGSDVCLELCEILPRLVPGVIVHFHDMFWPFEYPRKWVVEERRSWNELYAVRAILANSAGWRILMFNHYFAQFERALIEKTYPDFNKNPGGALWIEKQSL